jgi:hypothetical protein
MHKTRSIHKWFVEIGVEEPHWTPLGWIEIPTESQAWSLNINAQPH